MEDSDDTQVQMNPHLINEENTNVNSNCEIVDLMERNRDRSKSMPPIVISDAENRRLFTGEIQSAPTLVSTPLLPFSMTNSPVTPMGTFSFAPAKKPRNRYHSLQEKLEHSLTIEVEKTLRRVHKQRVSSFKQQQELETLFYDLTQRMEREHSDVVAEESDKNQFCYYFEYVAEYFKKYPQRASDLQPIFDGTMMSSNYFASIYALLFHKWLFEIDHMTISRLNVFLKGTNRLFWSDLENKTVKFKSLFVYLQRTILFQNWWTGPEKPALQITKPLSPLKVLTRTSSLHNLDQLDEKPKYRHKRAGTLISEYNPHIGAEKKLTPLDRKRVTLINRDLICLCAKYFFYYRHSTVSRDLLPFITQLAEQCQTNKIPVSAIDHDKEDDDQAYDIGGWGSLFDADNMWGFGTEIPNRRDHFTDMEGAISDLFVHENILLLSAIGDDRVMISILGHFISFRDLPLSARTVVRLQAALYAFSRPGGPTYPSRMVRHRAQMVMDALFPRGQYARFLINLSFRLLHQYTWPRSLLYWANGKAKQYLVDYPRQAKQFVNYHTTMEPKSLQFYDDEQHDADDYSKSNHDYLADLPTVDERWVDDEAQDATPSIQVMRKRK